MVKVAVVGGTGFLGGTLVDCIAKAGYEVANIGYKSPAADYTIDMSDLDESQKLLKQISPDIIVNLAALTNVDLCENNLELAYRVNTKVVENIAIFSRRLNTFVIHISTDHFYENGGECGSIESKVKIINNYAITKYCAEKSLLGVQATILRTNFFGPSIADEPRGFCDSMLSKARRGERLNLFENVYFSPLSVNSLCEVILLCLEKKLPGTFNVGSREGMSKSRFLLDFFSRLKLEIDYNLVSSDELGSLVPRPKDMRMDVSFFESVFCMKMPRLTDEIAKVVKSYEKI